MKLMPYKVREYECSECGYKLEVGPSFVVDPIPMFCRKCGKKTMFDCCESPFLLLAAAAGKQ